MSEVPDDKPNDETAVLTFRLFGQDPYCLSYIFKISTDNEENSPIHLEQLTIAIDVLTQHREEVERKVLFDAVSKARTSRRAEREYHAKVIAEDFKANSKTTDTAN